MYTLQGMIRTSIYNTTQQFERMGYVANNLVNYGTNGYKNIKFEQMMGENGNLQGTLRTDFSQGSLKITKSPYDVAIDGIGLIPVTSPTGEVQYTRDGSFMQGKDGYLMTRDGWLVGEGIKIPTNCYKFEIKPNGDVVSYDSKVSKEKFLGKIPLVQFPCMEGLEPKDMNKLASTEASGEATLIKNHSCFRQYNVEGSNTSIYDATSEMLRLNASLLATMQMAKAVDQMYQKAINIREG